MKTVLKIKSVLLLLLAFTSNMANANGKSTCYWISPSPFNSEQAQKPVDQMCQTKSSEDSLEAEFSFIRGGTEYIKMRFKLDESKSRQEMNSPFRLYRKWSVGNNRGAVTHVGSLSSNSHVNAIDAFSIKLIYDTIEENQRRIPIGKGKIQIGNQYLTPTLFFRIVSKQ